jgi:TolB-like protein/tRNA A-37 threonylcarbamoyl transferase component Bud32/Tfp pilus assembly protein PilF
MIGKTVSHYRILEKLGEGGMGVVYKAEDMKLHRRVALKILPRELAENSTRLARFEREATAVAALNHPNIVTVFSVEQTDGLHFITMELVEGKPLSELIPNDGLSLQNLFEAAIPLADAIAAAHQGGVVHRDLKPGNIMTLEGRVKVLDFGLAKLRDPTIETAATLSDEDPVTEEGRILGTVAYMSPEQAEGKPLDHRSDIFSLGIILYEMATGRNPFRGESGISTLSSILKDTPSTVTEVRPDLPNHLGRVIRRCLAKQPEHRYQSALDVRNELEGLKAETESRSATSGPHPGESRKHWIPWLAGVAVVAAALSIWIFGFDRQGEEAAPDGAAATEVRADKNMIVVFPFENLGPPEDNYFAAGMTEEITSRLAMVQGLAVMSRTSAVQYDRTGKTIPEIGEDLGADYVLEGTVRWERRPDGSSRVRVTPQLIRVSDDSHLWADRYDRAMEEIFQVQSEIAREVIKNLNVTLLQPERASVPVRATENLDAYHAYLRGRELAGGISFSRESYTLAVRLFEKAIELDPQFAQAHASLSRAHSAFFHFGYDRSPDRLTKAITAAEAALAIDEESTLALLALGYYYYWGLRDYPSALRSFRKVQERLSGNAESLAGIGFIYRRQGKLSEALTYLERFLTLDPQSTRALYGVAETRRLLKQYQAAQDLYDRVIALSPDAPLGYLSKARTILLWNGDLDAMRSTLESCPYSPGELIGADDLPYGQDLWFWLEIYSGNYERALKFAHMFPRIAESQYELIVRSTHVALCHDLMNRRDLAQAAWDSARVLLEARVEENPSSARARSALGIAYAGLGQNQEAIREGKYAVSVTPSSKDIWAASTYVYNLALIHTLLGDSDTAVDRLEYLLSEPNDIASPALLRISPLFDSLRDDPEFQLLTKVSS